MTADPIAHLDFTPAELACECPACGAHDEPHHDPATHCIRVHSFGDCKQHPGGMVAQLVCQRCLNLRRMQIYELVQTSYRSRYMTGNFLICGSCQNPIVHLAQIFETRAI